MGTGYASFFSGTTNLLTQQISVENPKFDAPAPKRRLSRTGVTPGQSVRADYGCENCRGLRKGIDDGDVERFGINQGANSENYSIRQGPTHQRQRQNQP